MDMSQEAEIIDKALHQSGEAFNTYRNRSGQQRARFLEAIAAEIEALGDPLIRQAMVETNLPEARLVGERGRTCNQLRQFAAMVQEGSWVDVRIDTALPDRQPLPKPDLRKMMIPLGPVVVFGASNFPFAYSTAGVDTASALAAGCTVVLKAHPAHPETSDMVASAIEKAIKSCGEHPHVFQHVHAPSFEGGKMLVQHALTKAVGFTGSFSGGKALYDYATARKEPIPVFAEMGSINPVFILPKALKVRGEKVADMYASSITQGVGQFCTNPGLMLAQGGQELEMFSKVLAEKIRAVAPATMLHPGIAQNFIKNRGKALGEKGVTLVAESDTAAVTNQGIPTVATVHAENFLKNPALVEEVFGPYSLLVVSKSKDELFKALDAIPGQLTATIIGEEDELVEYADFIQRITDRVGRVIINGVPTGVEVCPSMHHGGPFPATTDSRFTSVGIDAAKRWVRPVSYQNFPHRLLPQELQDGNPLGIWRLVNNTWTK